MCNFNKTKRYIIVSCIIIFNLLFVSCNSSYDNAYNHEKPNEERYKTVFADLSKLQNGEKSFALREKVAYWGASHFDKDTKKISGWGYDMKSCNVSKMDLSYIEDYNDVTFDSQTKFPDDTQKMPIDFDPEYILEFNKNPGLGIRELHEQGITGKGVGIAIIDQALLLEHEQYKDNLTSYEKIHCSDNKAQMHGTAVASISVGKDIGVAPESKLYYIASTFGHWTERDEDFDLDFTILADCILRIIEINQILPEDEKIRVISISRGYTSEDTGYEELEDAIDKANDENIFVITLSVYEYYQDFNFFGAHKDYYANPDDFTSYEPPSWVTKDTILFPMGSRTHASCTGTENYEISHAGGVSWVVPWCAGFYALCCQVKPDITPREFINIVTETSVPAKIFYNGKTYNYGNIVNPAEVIKILREKN